ncbi:MAG: alkaline phosphatase, partial [Lachnospiraceae bacterium]|nr:alkaline phosphatase [Lachnospiraceae bacterium]
MRKSKKALASILMALSLTVMGGCSDSKPAETVSVYVRPTESSADAGTTSQEASKPAVTSPEASRPAETTQRPTEDETIVHVPQTDPTNAAPEPTEEPTTETLPETTAETQPETTQEVTETPKRPKYVFLFIGDGMGLSHIQAASYYKAAVEGGKNYDPTKSSYAGNLLNFQQFPVVGSVVNYNGDSFITDSAAAITAIVTGHKTATDAIGVNADGTARFETIAEKVKSRLGYKVGVVSNANINHATPAGYYGHQVNRTMYYELGLDMLASGFDYFGGGAIRQPKGADGTRPDLYDLAKAQGYKVYRDQDAALSKLNESMGRVLITSEQRGEGEAMRLRVDAEKGAADLADYVTGGLKVLGDQQGFFYGIEGGLIDWAAHENDAGAVVREVLDLEKAVGAAMAFYNAHPDETLILVTADHETGGFGLGYSNMGYELYPQGLKKQKMSYRDYYVKIALEYRPNNTDWETVVWDIRSLFGLTFDGTYQEGDDPKLKMTKDEVLQLNAAYLASMKGETATMGTAAYEMYGSYEPLAFTVTTILGKKCGVNFTTVYHTAQPIPIYAIGVGAQEFSGTMD